MSGGYFGVYRGRVVNNADPLMAGRVQVQVPAVTGLRQIGWSEPSHPSGFPVVAPLTGQDVWVAFEGGDTMRPVWLGVIQTTTAGLAPITLDALNVLGNLTVGGTATFTGAYTTTGFLTASGGAQVTTSSTGGSANTLRLNDSASTNYVHLRARGGPGGLEVINQACSGPLLFVDNLGNFVAGGAVNDSSGRVYSPGNPQPNGVGGNYVTTDTAQTITWAKTFAVSPTVPDSSWSIATTTGLQAALDSKYSPTNPQPVTPPSMSGAMMLMGA